MEARLKPLAALCLAACVVAVSCDDDPARSVKIAKAPAPTASSPSAPPAANPPAAAQPNLKSAADAEPRRPTDDIVRAPRALTTPIDSKASEWRPPGCPPDADNATGPSMLIVTGPCAFEHRAPASCEVTPDDFLVTITRKGRGGSTVMIFVNVEKYKGPGRYEAGQIFVGVQDKTNIYRWSNDNVTATVGPGDASLILPTTKLEAEPLLVKCSGPMTNYQCDSRELATVIEGTVEVVSGTFMCEKRP